jgi:magnesium transporter
MAPFTTLEDIAATSEYFMSPTFTTDNVVGITVAIIGNVVISFALNLQKLAHKRLDEQSEKQQSANGSTPLKTANRRPSTVREETTEDDPPQSSTDIEAQPLLPNQHVDYGTSPSISTASSVSSIRARKPRRPTWLSRLLNKGRSAPADLPGMRGDSSVIPVEVMTENDFANRRKRKQPKPEVVHEYGPEHGNETKYLKSKLW